MTVLFAVAAPALVLNVALLGGGSVIGIARLVDRAVRARRTRD